MDLVLVRHALPMRVERAEGPADPGLAARGRVQAARVPAALAHLDVVAAYCSPARRAQETAAPFLAARGLVPTTLDGLAEFDHGSASYVPVEELRARNDPMWQRLQAGLLYSPDIDADAFRARVVASVEQVVATHPGGTVVLFTHAGAINAYAGHVLGQEMPIWFAPDYASITRVRAGRGGRRSIVSLNETAHVLDLLG